MSFQTIFMAATAFLATASAHVLMKSPVPYSVDKLDNSPITKAQYPCKSQNGFTVSTMNTMAVGEKQTLKLSGSAVHGGGSCQLSVSLDTEPTANSVFKVIKSMEGGCPGTDGEAESYDFELPSSIPNGKATFAWTWNSKLSGLPELYMYVLYWLCPEVPTNILPGIAHPSKSLEALVTTLHSTHSLICLLPISTIAVNLWPTLPFNTPILVRRL